MKSNTFMLILTSIVCLLPMVLGLVLYKDLPAQVVMQWNLEGEPNWFAPKAVAAFAMPLFFAGINILTITLINRDSRRENISKKMMAVVQWLIPLIALVTVPIVLFMAMGIELPVTLIIFTLVGIIIVLIGNYLPKCRQNHSVGIRISWTLSDSENWNKTHRIGGFLWTLGGIMFIIFAFLPFEENVLLIFLFLILTILVLIPILYSYSLHKKSTQKERAK